MQMRHLHNGNEAFTTAEHGIRKMLPKMSRILTRRPSPGLSHRQPRQTKSIAPADGNKKYAFFVPRRSFILIFAE